MKVKILKDYPPYVKAGEIGDANILHMKLENHETVDVEFYGFHIYISKSNLEPVKEHSTGLRIKIKPEFKHHGWDGSSLYDREHEVVATIHGKAGDCVDYYQIRHPITGDYFAVEPQFCEVVRPEFCETENDLREKFVNEVHKRLDEIESLKTELTQRKAFTDSLVKIIVDGESKIKKLTERLQIETETSKALALSCEDWKKGAQSFEHVGRCNSVGWSLDSGVTSIEINGRVSSFEKICRSDIYIKTGE